MLCLFEYEVHINRSQFMDSPKVGMYVISTKLVTPKGYLYIKRNYCWGVFLNELVLYVGCSYLLLL